MSDPKQSDLKKSPTFWRWCIATTSGSWPYLHIVPCSSRLAAQNQAKMRNRAHENPLKGQDAWKVRRLIITLAKPSQRELTPGLRVEKRVSILRPL